MEWIRKFSILWNLWNTLKISKILKAQKVSSKAKRPYKKKKKNHKTSTHPKTKNVKKNVLTLGCILGLLPASPPASPTDHCSSLFPDAFGTSPKTSWSWGPSFSTCAEPTVIPHQSSTVRRNDASLFTRLTGSGHLNMKLAKMWKIATSKRSRSDISDRCLQLMVRSASAIFMQDIHSSTSFWSPSSGFFSPSFRLWFDSSSLA